MARSFPVIVQGCVIQILISNIRACTGVDESFTAYHRMICAQGELRQSAMLNQGRLFVACVAVFRECSQERMY